MSLGLPSHLVPRALSRALAKGAHAVALSALLSGISVIVAFMAARPELVLWPALLALLFMLGALWWVDRSRHIVAGIAYLAIGTISTYVYAAVLASQLPELLMMSQLWLALPKVAMLMVAGLGIGLLPAIGWPVLGYLLGEFAALIALTEAGIAPRLDIVNLVALVEAIGVSALGFYAVVSARKSQPRMLRAAQDELLDDIRSRMELRAAALMHDTILSHLAAIASSTSAELQPQQVEEIERDLQILVGQEWLQEDAPVSEPEVAADWRVTPLNSAIQDVRKQGLEVLGTGDFGALTRLDRARGTALGLAAKQCLVNVIKHSGVMKAEVAVYGSDVEISVMIIDAGKGFADDAVDPDRLGLRASVRRRIEAVGGAVQIWSTPGSGTSILIQLPLEADSTGDLASMIEPSEEHP